MIQASIRAWPTRLGIAIFLFSGYELGLHMALFFTVIYVACWLALGKPKAAPRRAKRTTHGSASGATLRQLIASDNVTVDLDPSRFILGVLKEPVTLARNQPAALTLSRRYPWERLQALPIVATGSKDAAYGHPDDGHAICLAGAGAGKGVSVVLPNLRVYAGSTVVFDPKGENFLGTFEARLGLGNRVCLADPFGAVPPELREEFGVRINPLQPLEDHYLAGRDGDVYDEAAGIADLIVVTTGKEMQPYFNDKARAVIKSAILFVTYADIYQDREKYPLNLLTVKDVIDAWFLPREKHKLLTEICRRSPHLRSVPPTVCGMANDEYASVIGTVYNHMDFLNSSNVQWSLSASDLCLEDLKREKVSLYLVLPANQIKAYDRLARLWVGTLIRAMMQDSRQSRHRVLFMLDEVGQLGALDPLVQLVTLGRGYGIDAFMIFQDMAQGKAAYGETFPSLLANAKYQIFFGVRDLETAEMVSKMLGKETITTETETIMTGTSDGTNVGTSAGGGDEKSTRSRGRSATHSCQHTIGLSSLGRDLLTPDEVLTLPETDLIIMMAGRHPVQALKFDTRRRFFRDALESAALFDRNDEADASTPRLAAPR